MSGKHLHELRIDPLLSLLEAYFQNGTVELDGRNVGGMALVEGINEVLWHKYKIRLSSIGPILNGKMKLEYHHKEDRVEAIRANEAKDVYHYPRNYDGFETPVLGGMTVWR